MHPAVAIASCSVNGDWVWSTPSVAGDSMPADRGFASMVVVGAGINQQVSEAQPGGRLAWRMRGPLGAAAARDTVGFALGGRCEHRDAVGCWGE